MLKMYIPLTYIFCAVNFKLSQGDFEFMRQHSRSPLFDTMVELLLYRLLDGGLLLSLNDGELPRLGHYQETDEE